MSLPAASAQTSLRRGIKPDLRINYKSNRTSHNSAALLPRTVYAPQPRSRILPYGLFYEQAKTSYTAETLCAIALKYLKK
jgi:hypothetical protein